MNRKLNVADLTTVVWSSGRVFDGLLTGRLDTERFLRSGSLSGVTSRSDLALLKDLRDAAQHVIDHQEVVIDASYAREINKTLSRSAALEPGRFRSNDDRIGVETPLGRHEPPALDEEALELIISKSLAERDPREQALCLFVEIARAQPFMEGNKRTAIFVANSVLIRQTEPLLLAVPTERELAKKFMHRLADAYINKEYSGVKNILRRYGFVSIGDSEGEPETLPRLDSNQQPFD